jgi:hypothetical protein
LRIPSGFDAAALERLLIRAGGIDADLSSF